MQPRLRLRHGRPTRPSLELFGKTLELQKAKLGPDHPDTLQCMGELADSYAEAGQFHRALKLFGETLELKKLKFGPGHPKTLVTLENQTRCLADSGQLDRAEAAWDANIAARRQAQGDGHRDTLGSRLDLAEFDLARGRLDAAEAAERTLLDDCRARLGPDDSLTTRVTLALARVREARGDRDAAAALYHACARIGGEHATDHLTLAKAVAESGRSRLRAGDWPVAEARLREALAIRESEMPQHSADRRDPLAPGRGPAGRKKPAEAVPLLRSGYEAMARATAIPLVDRPRLAERSDRLIAAGELAGSRAEVDAWKAERARLAPEPRSRERGAEGEPAERPAGFFPIVDDELRRLAASAAVPRATAAFKRCYCSGRHEPPAGRRFTGFGRRAADRLWALARARLFQRLGEPRGDFSALRVQVLANSRIRTWDRLRPWGVETWPTGIPWSTTSSCGLSRPARLTNRTSLPISPPSAATWSSVVFDSLSRSDPMNDNRAWFGRRARVDSTAARGGGRGRDRRRARREVLLLEDRRLMTATIAVTSTADTGAGTLRDALEAADGYTVPVTIDFELATPATITPTAPLDLSNKAAPITIDGPGAGELDIHGNNATRVFEIVPTRWVALGPDNQRR